MRLDKIIGQVPNPGNLYIARPRGPTKVGTRADFGVTLEVQTIVLCPSEQNYYNQYGQTICFESQAFELYVSRC